MLDTVRGVLCALHPTSPEATVCRARACQVSTRHPCRHWVAPHDASARAELPNCHNKDCHCPPRYPSAALCSHSPPPHPSP